MADQPIKSTGRLSSSGNSSSTSAPPPPPPLPTSPVQPSKKKKHKAKVFRVFGSVFRTFPVINNPPYKFPGLHLGIPDKGHKNPASTKMTGTLYGYQKGRVTLSIQENPKCLPSLVVELAMQTNALQKEMGAGMVRIALECNKRSEKDKTRLIDERMWTLCRWVLVSFLGILRLMGRMECWPTWEPILST